MTAEVGILAPIACVIVAGWLTGSLLWQIYHLFDIWFHKTG